MMTPEEKYKKRLEACGLIPSREFGGAINFERLTAKAARELLNSGCAHPDGNTNGSPSFEEITCFLERNPAFVGHGYIVVPERSDQRITLEGVIAETDPDQRQVREFVDMFRRADEFDLDRYRAWYD